MKNKIKEELLDQLLENYNIPEDFLGPDGLWKELKERLINKILEAELTTELGYAKHGQKPQNESDNARNGHSNKTIRSDAGPLALKIPRDRKSEFAPKLIPKHQRHFKGFNETIIGLYCRGMTTRDIQDQLKEMYQVELSPELISNVTESVSEEVKQWQSRPLDPIYSIVYFDAIVVKVRDEGKVANRAIYLALGVTMEGHKEILGMWSSQNEGAKFWLGVCTELKNRGLNDILIACVDGLNGFVEAIEAVYPQTKVQLCIVHMIRNSLKFVGWKDKKKVTADLKKIYKAPTEQAAKVELEAFRQLYDKPFPAIGRSWEAHWNNIIPFFDYPEELRKVIYTTNAIESINSSLRKISRNRNLFPTTQAVYKLFYLAIRNSSKKWTRPISNWAATLNFFTIEFGDRINKK